MFLANLLPGVRELRGPLSAGLIWLLSIYIGIAPLLPKDLGTIEYPVLRDVVLLAEHLEAGIVLAALGFTAYIVGVMNAELTKRLDILSVTIRTKYRRMRKIPLARIDRLYGDSTVRPPGDFVGYAAESIFQRQVNNRQFWDKIYSRANLFRDLRSVGVIAQRIDSEYYSSELRNDIRLLPARLVAKEPAIFERWNRINAEAEFRQELIIPVAALSNVIAYRVAAVSIGNLLPSMAISATGGILLLILSSLSAERYREARVQLLEALDIGVGDSRVLKEIAQGEVHLQWGQIYRPEASGQVM